MKKLLAIILLFVAFSSKAQQGFVMPRDSTTGKVTYVEVVETEGVTASELYSRAREWVSTSFKSANNVLQMDDKGEGKLIGKAYQDFATGSGLSGGKNQMWYTFKIYVKDNKYRYEFTDISVKNYPDKLTDYKVVEVSLEDHNKRAYNKKGEIKEAFSTYYTSMDSGMKETIASLKAAMSKKTAGKEDW